MNIVEYKSLVFEPGSYVETNKVLTLLNSFVFFQPKFSLNGVKFYLNYRFLRSKKNTKYFYLSIVVNEFINLSNFLTNKLVDQKIKISLNTYSGQYVEPSMNLGKICTIPESYFKIEELKTSYRANSRLMLVGEQDYRTYFSEYSNNSYLGKNKLILKHGDFLLPNCKVKTAGYVVKSDPFRCKIRKGTPLFLSKKTICYRKTNDLLKKDDILGQIVFNQIVTGDIVQGLPKVEEILEARKKDFYGATLALKPGYVFSSNAYFIYVQTYLPLNSDNNIASVNVQEYPVSEQIAKVSVGDFITLGQPLSNEPVNVHVLLAVYFNYFKTLNSQEEAAYLSFRNIQFLLIDKVKGIYGSQGVTIADKHVEVIVRQMTSKVQITTIHSSFLLPNEIVEFKHVTYINSILKACNKYICYYDLILLGITKASLLTNSFISAASFQQTTKILMESAIEGKIDWLYGLKENVIVGRLIPSGGGFDYHSKFGLNMLEK
jgi:DNA-directed RNA polymerase subunit beta'